MKRPLIWSLLLLLLLASAEAEIPRTENLEKLRSQGFLVSPSLPIREGTTLRPKEEIVARLKALRSYLLWVASPDAERAEPFRRKIFEHGQKRWLTQEELAVFELDQAEARTRYLNDIGWQMENMWSLAWVLGFEQEPALSGQLQGDLARELVFRFADREQYTLRPVEQVRAAEDLFYCAHNAVRSAQLGKETVPDEFHPVEEGGGIHERRHGLTWCLSPGIEWDDTDLST